MSERGPISHDDTMRELHAYAMEEMRNRGLEEAAVLVEQMLDARRPAFLCIHEIRALKRNPTTKLSDWFGNSRPPNPRLTPRITGEGSERE